MRQWKTMAGSLTLQRSVIFVSH